MIGWGFLIQDPMEFQWVTSVLNWLESFVNLRFHLNLRLITLT